MQDVYGVTETFNMIYAQSYNPTSYIKLSHKYTLKSYLSGIFGIFVFICRYLYRTTNLIRKCVLKPPIGYSLLLLSNTNTLLRINL